MRGSRGKSETQILGSCWCPAQLLDDDASSRKIVGKIGTTPESDMF